MRKKKRHMTIIPTRIFVCLTNKRTMALCVRETWRGQSQTHTQSKTTLILLALCTWTWQLNHCSEEKPPTHFNGLTWLILVPPRLKSYRWVPYEWWSKYPFVDSCEQVAQVIAIFYIPGIAADFIIVPQTRLWVTCNSVTKNWLTHTGKKSNVCSTVYEPATYRLCWCWNIACCF